ncbi:acyltransferase [Deinococcus yavapaiensis]|uniref:Peptidoglycan/LPS O-acetylase OafA/YrhL n=1 Tax=Deinococcus yavapaiensis KR-236 TaxID=694435 RepID=A0A318S7J9_9DEIO|nr:acyltransferase [Deinococcus yavapaiensis]PYE54412.1 peptidoglycan/LPS O-acetylase OafA/YrhL [Deinococcus yavapaiensis KR-236]
MASTSVTSPPLAHPVDPPFVAHSAPAQKSRIEAINIFRGLAILEVVMHHTTGMALRFVDPGGLAHFLLAVVNRILHFAVPGFLFMTAVVLTRSALKRFEPKSYYWGRVKKSLMPYLIWTVLYVLFRVWTEQDPRGVLQQPERWQVWLQYGKGYFHLYFLLIALQFYLVLPLVLPLFRRKLNLPLLIAAAFGSQLVVYLLNREGVTNWRFPATMAVWYIPAITLGMYFGAHYSAFENLWRKWRLPLVASAAVGLAWYLPQAYAALVGSRVDNFSYNTAHWVYTTTFALVLFGFAHSFARAPQWFQRPLARLGSVSLQIYLVHPALLFFFEREGLHGEPFSVAVQVLVAFLASLLVPFVFARLLEGKKLSLWLFGR